MADQLQPSQDNNQQPANGGGYGKRPVWQWILIYLVIGAVVYFAIYYFVFAGNGTDDATNNTEQTEEENGGGFFNY